MEALAEEVAELWKAMEQQRTLLLELVRWWQGVPGMELENKPKAVEIYCNN